MLLLHSQDADFETPAGCNTFLGAYWALREAVILNFVVTLPRPLHTCKAQMLSAVSGTWVHLFEEMYLHIQLFEMQVRCEISQSLRTENLHTALEKVHRFEKLKLTFIKLFFF